MPRSVAPPPNRDPIRERVGPTAFPRTPGPPPIAEVAPSLGPSFGANEGKGPTGAEPAIDPGKLEKFPASKSPAKTTPHTAARTRATKIVGRYREVEGRCPGMGPEGGSRGMGTGTAEWCEALDRPRSHGSCSRAERSGAGSRREGKDFPDSASMHVRALHLPPNSSHRFLKSYARSSPKADTVRRAQRVETAAPASGSNRRRPARVVPRRGRESDRPTSPIVKQQVSNI